MSTQIENLKSHGMCTPGPAPAPLPAARRVRDVVKPRTCMPTRSLVSPRGTEVLGRSWRAQSSSSKSLTGLDTDPFAEADENAGDKTRPSSQQKIHIRIQQRNGRKTLTTVQGVPSKFDQKKILKVIKKKFACNGTIVNDAEMGEVIQLQGDQRKDVQEFLTDKKEGLGLDTKSVQVHGF